MRKNRSGRGKPPQKSTRAGNPARDRAKARKDRNICVTSEEKGLITLPRWQERKACLPITSPRRQLQQSRSRRTSRSSQTTTTKVRVRWVCFTKAPKNQVRNRSCLFRRALSELRRVSHSLRSSEDERGHHLLLARPQATTSVFSK